ncbi:Peroxisome biogenesis factor 6 [Oopsacas minuta]|uniref:Peroxisome biogenesis factor 6 n=1 Tax=Oopsacas minuta TaxID=111878 RepID=A0AAV7KE89_9METZ|nr:Peroxisome biogenesis factor 6 [Oopsacas minuta]
MLKNPENIHNSLPIIQGIIKFLQMLPVAVEDTISQLIKHVCYFNIKKNTCYTPPDKLTQIGIPEEEPLMMKCMEDCWLDLTYWTRHSSYEREVISPSAPSYPPILAPFEAQLVFLILECNKAPHLGDNTKYPLLQTLIHCLESILFCIKPNIPKITAIYTYSRLTSACRILTTIYRLQDNSDKMGFFFMALPLQRLDFSVADILLYQSMGVVWPKVLRRLSDQIVQRENEEGYKVLSKQVFLSTMQVIFSSILYSDYTLQVYYPCFTTLELICNWDKPNLYWPEDTMSCFTEELLDLLITSTEVRLVNSGCKKVLSPVAHKIAVSLQTIAKVKDSQWVHKCLVHKLLMPAFANWACQKELEEELGLTSYVDTERCRVIGNSVAMCIISVFALYIPDIPRNKKSIPSLLTEEDGLSGVLLSRIISDAESTSFNNGYIQLFTIKLLKDYSDSGFNTDKESRPIILFPNYLSSHYNIHDNDRVLLYKCQLPRLTKVVLCMQESVDWDRANILQLISSQCSIAPITCQTQSIFLISLPEKKGEITPVDQQQPRCLATRMVCTEEFIYGYIDYRTELELIIEPVKKQGNIRFIPHGFVDSTAIMLNHKDALLLGLQDKDWVEIEIKQTLSNNVFQNCDWFKIPPIDLELNPIKRLCIVIIMHERETICLQNCISHNVKEDLDRGTVLCYVASQNLLTNSPLHPNWYAFYGDIVEAKMPVLLASDVTLRQVMTPDIDTTDTYSVELQKYFDVPKLLREGDFICIENFLNREFLYYKVESLKVKDQKDTKAITPLNPTSNKLENELKWVAYEHSTLSQIGHMDGHTPHCYSMDEFYDCPFPYGLDESLVQLLRFVYPLVCMSSNPHTKFNNGILIEGKPGSGKATLARTIARLFSLHFIYFDCHDIVFDSQNDADSKLVTLFSSALRTRPCIVFLSSLQLLTPVDKQDTSQFRLAMYLSELICEYKSKEGLPLIIIGGTSSLKDIPESIDEAFHNTVMIPYLKSREVYEVMRLMTSRWVFASDVDLSVIAKDCHKFLLGDIQFVLNITNLNAVARTSDLLSELDIDILPCHNLSTVVTSEDITDALKQLRSQQSKTMKLTEIPKVNWDDIGGLEGVKEEIMSSLFFSSEEMSEADLKFKRCGLLLHGPPGCGKTMMAKAIATECKCHFLNVKGPELLDMYVGQSECNLRDLFDTAIESAPCILFFDEIDSLAPRRGDTGDSGGVMDRVSSQLLTEIDRVAKTPNVYVVAATNRIDLLDPALIRPGRLDRSIHVGHCETPEEIEKVFRAVTKNFRMDPEVDLKEMSQSVKGTVSGSHIYSICYDAMMNGLNKKVEELKREGKPDCYETIVVSKDDFDKAMSSFKEKNE